jgi:hypothetical protein
MNEVEFLLDIELRQSLLQRDSDIFPEIEQGIRGIYQISTGKKAWGHDAFRSRKLIREKIKRDRGATGHFAHIDGRGGLEREVRSPANALTFRILEAVWSESSRINPVINVYYEWLGQPVTSSSCREMPNRHD